MTRAQLFLKVLALQPAPELSQVCYIRLIRAHKDDATARGAAVTASSICTEGLLRSQISSLSLPPMKAHESGLALDGSELRVDSAQHMRDGAASRRVDQAATERHDSITSSQM